jgi:Adenylate cyclase regulatory domain
MRQPRVPSGGPAAVGLISLADAQQSGGWRRRAHSRRILIGSAWRLYLGVVTTDSKFSGLVDGLHGQARQEREELILWLLDRGFDVDQVRNTLSPILLPANRVFGDDGTLVSARDVADASGVPLDLILRLHRAAGLAVVDDPDKALYTRADAESILPAAAVVDHGIDLDHVVLVVRLLMEGLTRAAVAMRQGGLQTLLRPGATEVELAEAFETLARDTQPMIDPMTGSWPGWHCGTRLRRKRSAHQSAPRERCLGGARSRWHSPMLSASPD